MDVQISVFNPKKWERLKFLDNKMETGNLALEEELESLRLAEEYEDYSVQRLKFLIRLAAIRKISLEELMDQLGLKPYEDD